MSSLGFEGPLQVGAPRVRDHARAAGERQGAPRRYSSPIDLILLDRCTKHLYIPDYCRTATRRLHLIT